MKRATLTEERLREFLGKFANCRIAVLGDFFLDKYLDVDPRLVEPSVETGKPAHQVVGVHCSPGAAGTVVNNLAALGPDQLHAVGVVGDDGEAFELRRSLDEVGCCTNQLISAAEFQTPTYLKPRDVTVPGLVSEHSRYDTKNRRVCGESLQQQVIQAAQSILGDVDAMIVLDQVEQPECGVVSSAVRAAVRELAHRHSDVVFWADSRSRIHDFQHLIIKCNEYEAVGLHQPRPGTDIDDDQLLRAVKKLRAENNAPVVVTRGPGGAWVSDPAWTCVAGVRIEGPLDTTGAGDSLTAGNVLALCAGASLTEAAVVGNLVASLTIQQLGTTGVATQDQLLDRFQLWHAQQSDV